MDTYRLAFRAPCSSYFFILVDERSLQVRFADRFVDPALGFCAGINFFVFEAMLIPFEVVAFNLVLQFWTDKIPVAAVITVRSIYLAYIIDTY
jgi:amino acid transporter